MGSVVEPAVLPAKKKSLCGQFALSSDSVGAASILEADDKVPSDVFGKRRLRLQHSRGEAVLISREL